MKTSDIDLVTENDLKLPRRRALVRQRRAIVPVRHRRRARLLEELRISRRPARLRTVVLVPAAQLVGPERLAPALAPHHGPVSRGRPQLQRLGTRGEQVRPAPHDGAVALPLVGRNGHGDVEPVNQADRVGGLVLLAVVEAELGEGGGGGAAGPGALEAAAAVAGGAGEVAGGGGGAAGAGPDPAGPVLGGAREGAVGELVEVEAAPFEDGEAGVGLDGGPDWVGAVVDYGHDEVRAGSIGDGEDQGKEEREAGEREKR